MEELKASLGHELEGLGMDCYAVWAGLQGANLGGEALLEHALRIGSAEMDQGFFVLIVLQWTWIALEGNEDEAE